MAITAQDTKLKPGYKQTEVGVIPEDWELKSFRDVCRVNQGLQIAISNRLKNPTKKSKIYITIQYLNDGKEVEYIDNYTSSVCCDKDDILMTRTGNTGVVVSGVEGVFHNNFFKINYDKGIIDKDFLVYYLNMKRTQNIILTKAGTSTIPDLNHNDFYSIPIPLPTKAEQTTIATVLSDIDALITLLDTIIGKKRDIKQATMQQLLTGKTRLPGFSGERKVKKLGEIGEKFVNGGTPSTQKPEYWQGNIPWITGADVINQKISDIRRFITREAVQNSSTNIVERGNLLLVTRTGVGKLALAPFDVAISQDITGIYVKKGQALVEYLFHYFNYNSESLKSLNQGTSIAGITRETLLSTNVSLPSFLEQRAIAAILSDMDAEIVALEQKRDKTRALKQGMMQELLTGKTRLV